MTLLDYGIVFFMVVGLAALAINVKRYTQSVVSFLAANRIAKRYLLTAAEGAAGLGAISVVAMFEIYYSAGFTPAYWELIFAPLWLVLALSGWIIYRFRQTRCLTLAQFFELRYSRKFRIFAGLVTFLSGILNYGIFPAVSARFFVYSLGLNPVLRIPLLGTVPTYACLMILLLGMALFITLNGGQTVVIITDFIQGQLINIVFIGIVAFILIKIPWSEITSVMQGSAEGQSMVNPFETSKADTFTYWFFLIILFGRFYGYMCWQGSQGYNASAKTPHEARMARILGQWRTATLSLLPLLAAAAVWVVMSSDSYAPVATEVKECLASIKDPAIQTQMRVPVGLTRLLPAGLLGLFIAVMLAASISTDSTYLHSWGSIFVQDVLMPLRGRPFSSRQHLLYLKLSVVAVAVFAFSFSLFFTQTEYIIMFFQITGALFASGAGICIIGGLYWKWGTTLGAWGAMLTAIILVLSGFFAGRMIPGFPLNYIQVVFVSQISSSAVYVILSLFAGRKECFDLNSMLHRKRGGGTDDVAGKKRPKLEWNMPVRWFERRMGVGSDFTRSDKVLFYATVFLCLFMIGVFFALFLWDRSFNPSETSWSSFWRLFIYFQFGLSVVITLVILLGGASNLRDMVRDMKNMSQNEQDDGFVVDRHNRGDSGESPE